MDDEKQMTVSYARSLLKEAFEHVADDEPSRIRMYFEDPEDRGDPRDPAVTVCKIGRDVDADSFRRFIGSIGKSIAIEARDRWPKACINAVCFDMANYFIAGIDNFRQDLMEEEALHGDET